MFGAGLFGNMVSDTELLITGKLLSYFLLRGSSL